MIIRNRLTGSSDVAEKETAMRIFIQLAGNINYKIEGKEILPFKGRKEVTR